MESLLVFVTALGLVALLEIGDKTQLVTISLATRHPWARVLPGAVLGLTAATAIGATIGGALAVTLGSGLQLIRIAGGVLFIGLGIWSVIHAGRNRDRSAQEEIPLVGRHPFWLTAGFLFLAEFGDKTQIAVIVLAASTAAPVSVFAGASLAESLVAVTSVLIGAGLAKALAVRWIQVASTALFLIAGALLILEALSVL